MAQVVRRLIGSKPKREKTLSDVGISNIADKKLQERINEYKTQMDGYIRDCISLPETETYTIEKGPKKGQEAVREVSPEKKIQVIIEKMQKINGKLQEISLPWGRAGTNQPYSELVVAWSSIVSELLGIATGTAFSLNETASQSVDPLRAKNEAVSNLHDFVVDIFIKYGQILYGVSWSNPDVVNAWALTLYQPPMPAASRIGFDQFLDKPPSNPEGPEQ